MNDHIESVAEWLALPEITFPILRSTDESGATFVVQKVGFLAVSAEDCKKAGITGANGPAGKCWLSTAVVEFGGEQKLCKLPVELSPWAFNCVGMAQSKQLSFPTRVEFGMLNGRKYAEFV